jgi:acyl phosphate:glycerol-3-phosphate acyltransferase
MQPFVVVIIAYALGSIPFGYLIVRYTQGADVRETGSGGTGATNVSRRAGKTAGVLTLLLDVLKGAAAVLFAKVIFGLPIVGLSQGPNLEETYWWVGAAAVATILGHMFPVWLGFRGGKGVATGVGVFLMIMPAAVLLAAVIFLVIVCRTRYVSLGSMLAAAAIPLFVVLLHLLSPSKVLIPTLAAACAGSLLIVFAHRQNIERLISGTESKFQ